MINFESEQQLNINYYITILGAFNSFIVNRKIGKKIII